MHLALICDEYPPAPHGGIGSVSRDLAEGLVEAGQRATVIGISTTEAGKPLRDEIVNGVRVVRLPTASKQIPQRLIDWWERWELLRALHRLHKETPFDVIECPDYGGWLPFGGIPGVPTVIRIHGSTLFFDSELGRRPSAREHRLEQRSLERATYLAAVSQYAGRRTQELAGLQDRACSLIYNAVDTEIFSPGPAEAIEPGLIVYVNSLSPKKGIEQLLIAANTILPPRPRARLVVIGAMPLRDSEEYHTKLRKLVDGELRNRVIFTGRMPRGEVVAWLRRSAVCCYPSHMEAFAIAPLEAMSVGRPVVFTLRGPGPEAIEDGISGLLCEPTEPTSIANCVGRLLDDPGFAESLGKNARRRIEAMFDKRAWIGRNLEFYRRCPGVERALSASAATGLSKTSSGVWKSKAEGGMHIGIVCDEYPPAPHGGIGSVSRDLAEGLAAEGHQVTVVGMSTTQPVRRESQEIVNGVRVVRLPASPKGKRRRLTSWWERRQLRLVLQRLHRETPMDLVECPDYAGWLPDGGIPGVPLVVRIHGSNLFYDCELDREPSLREHQLERRCLARADFFAAVSRYAGRRTLELAGLGERSCTVIPNAVDTSLFSAGESSEVEPGLVVFVNWLNPKKGIEELIDAVNLTFPERPGARLAVIGEAPDTSSGYGYLAMLRSKVKPELIERVIFAGRLPRMEVRSWLRRAAVCCYPSHMETFGIAPLEAMAVGRPVIFMKEGPGPELVEDGVSGLLCDSRDPRDVSRCISQIIDAPDFAAELGRNARKRVERMFDKQSWAARNARFYRACLENRAKGTKPSEELVSAP